ncbi:MAG: HAD family hydrolase [Candidatus Omnitrophica bacterium]|nr:HAD family hydrolase [Candidatus Omnitrophota bacterium]
MNIKAIILDFDGVIVESVGIKDAAFKELFKGYPQQFDEIIAYHIENNATIRFEKFKHITENILKQPFTPEREAQLCQDYSNYIVGKIIAAPFVEGLEDFLKEYAPQMTFYIATVNPEDEFQRILIAKKIAQYFKKVYTYPWKKVDAFREILKQEGFSAEQVIYVGDTQQDYLAAKETGVHFIGRDSGRPFEDANVLVCKDFCEIKQAIQRSAYVR